MVRIYEAANSTEAHIVRGLLESRGIQSRVEGEYLQGAMGELPAAGLAAVSVEEDDVEEALRLIGEYDQGTLDEHE